MTPGRAGDPLKSYRSKRDFARTPEPQDSAGGNTRNAPRFVIHEHSARRMHWDLRLERDGVLVCWAIPKGMPEEPKVNHIAPHTEDHPLSYLDFEGVIPAGSYGAGTMRVWDRGTYECLKWEPRKVEVALHGERLDARYALFAIGREADSRDWMIHRMDPAADPALEPMPAKVAPMLARAGTLPRDDDRWAFEIKWDGVRAIAYSSRAACAWRAATCARSRPATRSWRGSPARSARAGPCWTARSSPSTAMAVRASARLRGACTSARRHGRAGSPRSCRSPM